MKRSLGYTLFSKYEISSLEGIYFDAEVLWLFYVEDCEDTLCFKGPQIVVVVAVECIST